MARALTTPERIPGATAPRPVLPAALMLGLAWLAPQFAMPVLLGVLIAAALRALAGPLADQARLPQRIGALLVVTAASLGAALGAWAGQVSLVP